MMAGNQTNQAGPMPAVLALSLLAVRIITGAEAPAEAVKPLPEAHAHNDYHHPRPLLDALARGFTSVEADIFLAGGKLLVGHGLGELRPERTLEALYLKPLLKLVRKNGGRVYPGGPAFTLLIDIKSDGEKTFDALEAVLQEYEEMLTTVRDGRADVKAVTVILSGNRARDRIAACKVRHAGIDGRLSDLDSKLPSHLLPLISDRWTSHFRWRGIGPLPEEERGKLEEIVRKAHARGRRLRFWATPERPALWKELRRAGVDLINTDDLDGLREFLLRQEEKPGNPGDGNQADRGDERPGRGDFGDVEEARAAAGRLLGEFPGDPGAILVLANVENRAGSVERALPLFREAVRLDPGLYRVRESIGDILTRMGRPAEALREYRSSLQGPGPDEDRARLHLKCALALVTLGKNREAEEVIRNALKSHPDSGPLHYQLAQVLLERGESVEALKELEEARRKGEEEEAVEYAISRAHFLSGNRQAGEEALARYRALKEKNPVPRLNRFRKQRDETWEFVYRRIAALAYMESASVYRRHGQSRKARSSLEAALRKDARFNTARFLLVRLLEESGDLDRALEEFEILLREAADPGPLKKPAAALYLRRARQLIQRPTASREDHERALEQARRSLELHPTPDAHDAAAWANLFLGHPDRCLEHLWEAVRLDPENPARREKLKMLERKLREVKK